MAELAPRHDRGTAHERGQSNVIGVVLIIALTVLGVSGVLVFGTAALDDATKQSEIDAAEHAMTQLDSRFSLVALGSAEYQTTSVSLDGGATLRVDGDRGWMNVSVINGTDGDVEQTVLNSSLGAVIYENDGRTIAYQGGGVWKRAGGNGSVMVSPPEFHYRTRGGDDPTLTLPLVVVEGQGTIGERASVAKGATVDRFPVTGDGTRSNPLESGEINVTVHSEFYRAWGAFFEERTGGDVSYDHARNEVVITLVVHQTAPSVTGGIISGASGVLTFGNQGFADSYNSSSGDYDASSGMNTTIVAAGPVTLGQKAKLEGNLVTGGSVSLGQNANVTGNVSYGGTATIDPKAEVGGTLSGGANVDTPGSARWLIDRRRNSIEDSPTPSPAIDSATDTLISCSPSCTLESGDYYLSEMDLDGGELILDTTGGDVNVAVDGDADLSNAKVRVVGGNRSRIYLEGNMAIRQANVSVPGERSPQMWIYMNPDAKVTDFKQTRFVGVIYGPGGGVNTGVDIQIQTDNDVYGGLVGVPSSIGQSTDIHYDEALSDEDPLFGYSGGQPTVTYMHVTENRVTVSAP